MRKKFKVYYPKDHPDPEKAGQRYFPPEQGMVTMNSEGIFFVYYGHDYYPTTKKLSLILPKYDVVWDEKHENAGEIQEEGR